MALERFIDPPEAAHFLGLSEDLVREYMRLGVIRAKNTARPGSRRTRMRTTLSWLRDYQEGNTTHFEGPLGGPPITPASLRPPVSSAGLSYREWRRRKNTR